MNEDGSRSRGRMGRIAVAAVLLCGAALPVAGRAGERAPGAVPDFAESRIQRLEIELEGGGAMRLAAR